jgi:CheY-like chemotaxis protein
MNPIRTLLIIDDDEVFVYLTKKTIQETNLINLINVFGNGLDAINFIKENIDNPDSLPEIILLDLSMPIMDGWDFLEDYLLLMPTLSRKINIYIVSSSISPFDIVRAKSISAVTDYIIKPITKEKLIEIIKPI